MMQGMLGRPKGPTHVDVGPSRLLRLRGRSLTGFEIRGPLTRFLLLFVTQRNHSVPQRFLKGTLKIHFVGLTPSTLFERVKHESLPIFELTKSASPTSANHGGEIDLSEEIYSSENQTTSQPHRVARVNKHPPTHQKHGQQRELSNRTG